MPGRAAGGQGQLMPIFRFVPIFDRPEVWTGPNPLFVRAPNEAAARQVLDRELADERLQLVERTIMNRLGGLVHLHCEQTRFGETKYPEQGPDAVLNPRGTPARSEGGFMTSEPSHEA